MKGFAIYPAMHLYATMIKDLINGIMFDINLAYCIYLQEYL